MNERVLLVDDEPRVLDGYRRNLRRYDLETAEGPQEGLAILRRGGPYAVVVSDLQMPEMDGIEFLTRVREVAPDTIRMMLTGQADLDASMAAVNTGRVFRFLTKPCPADVLSASLDAAIDQYRLVTAERDLLENTLRNTAQVLVDLLEMMDPVGHAQARHVQQHVAATAAELGHSPDWRLELAAMLAPVGTVGLPSALLDKMRRGKPLSGDEVKMAGSHAQSAYNLLIDIPRMGDVARIILSHERPPSGRPLRIEHPDDDDRIAMGAHLIHIALTYERASAAGKTPAEALEVVRKGSGPAARAQLVAAFAATIGDRPAMVRQQLRIDELAANMVVVDDILAANGVMLLSKGGELTQAVIERLRVYASGVGVVEPLVVLVPRPAG